MLLFTLVYRNESIYLFTYDISAFETDKQTDKGFEIIIIYDFIKSQENSLIAHSCHGSIISWLNFTNLFFNRGNIFNFYLGFDKL